MIEVSTFPVGRFKDPLVQEAGLILYNHGYLGKPETSLPRSFYDNTLKPEGQSRMLTIATRLGNTVGAMIWEDALISEDEEDHYEAFGKAKLVEALLIAVKPEERRQGIASAIVKGAITFGFENGANIFYVVWPREDAMNFWDSLGLEEVPFITFSGDLHKRIQ